MEKQTTFTQAELMERWGYSKQTIINMENDGRLHRLHQLPGVRYRAKDVYALEELDKEEWGTMSPFEKRRLVKERDDWKERALYLQSVLQRIVVDASVYMKDEAMRQLNVKEG